MKNKQWLLVVLALFIAGATAWWLQQAAPATPNAKAAGASGGASSGPAGQGRGGPPAVEIATVQAVRLQDETQAIGNILARQSVTLRPEVSGRVARIAFEDGSKVRQGQLLVQLDDALQRAELSQARAQLSIVQANTQRNEELVAQNFVAQRVLDESRANLQVAQAQVDLAQARLARMSIVAPFSGTVGIASVNVGEYLKDGAAVVNLEDTSSLVVDFRLSERYQTRVAVGQAVQVQVDALPGQTFKARVMALDPLLDANGRAVAVRASMPADAAKRLRSGMFARVTVVFGVDEAALVVPEEALLPQGGRQWVVALDKAPEVNGKPQWTARRVAVITGVRRGSQVQILEGVEAGQTIVVAGQQRIQNDGTPVRVVELKSMPTAGKTNPQ
jgi:membrane fusion protein (multidrug efflux system)